MTRFALLIVVSCVFAVACYATSASAQEKPMAGACVGVTDASLADPIQIDSGKVSGMAVGEKQDVRVYKGIPFAAPPVGDLRWKPPQGVKAWEGVRVCTAFAPACPQPRVPIIGATHTNEDCLYLNVWTPARRAGESLPVMVWIHGGAYVMGTAATYDGEALARQGVVVVTINYRLGPFGFLAHPLLSKESDKGVSGNYGLLDQIAALEWVKRNIGAFGGDSGCVTIFGESAGAGSVCHLMVSPLAKGLFHRAIAESGSARGPARHLREKWNAQEPMEALGEDYAKSLGCTGDHALAELRAKTPEELVKAIKPSAELFAGGFTPIVDGWVIPDEPMVLFDQGKAANVPFMTGTNADEGTLFTMALPIKTVAEYQLGLKRYFQNDADQIFKLFPADQDKDVRAALNRAVTVCVFVASARGDARAMSRENSNAYLYRFTRAHPWAKAIKMGVFHASEIPYVFGKLPEKLGYEAYDPELAKTMSACWVRFAKTGDPNGGNLPHWPAYDPRTDQYMEFGDTVRVGQFLEKPACDLLDKIASDRLKPRGLP